MTIGYIAKLTRGGAIIDLSSGRYALLSFVPPTANETPVIAYGTSANRFQGGSLVGRGAANMSFDFDVRILAASAGEVERAIADMARFLRGAGNENDPTYLEFQPDNYVPYKPLWGQAAWRRLEVVSGVVNRTSSWMSGGDVRSKFQEVGISLNCKPYALGMEQVALSATGGIWEDNAGLAGDGYRGVWIGAGITNYWAKPINFNLKPSATDWQLGTAGANLIEEKNLNPEYLLFGVTSVKLTRKGATTITYTTTPSLTGTTVYCMSFYAKRPDGAAVTAADVKAVYNGSAQTSTYQSVGNGWYRVWYSAAYTSGTVGLSVETLGACIYVDGFQCENAAYPTGMIYRYWMGGSYSSSTHVRGAGRMRGAVADLISWGGGTVRMVLELTKDNTVAADFHLFSHDAATKLRAYYQASDDKFYFTDGTNTASTAAQTWSAADRIILHFTWGPSGLAIYKNGASAGTVGTYTPFGGGTYIYVGSSSTPDSWIPGMIMDFTTWAVPFTSTQVTNDYNNIYQIIADGQRTGYLFYMYDYSGDKILDNYYDSAANYSYTAICGGVPGDLPAITTYAIDNTVAAQGLTLNNWGWRFPILPDAEGFFGDYSGVARTGALTSEADETVLSTAATAGGTHTFDLFFHALYGRMVHLFIRANGTNTTNGANFYIKVTQSAHAVESAPQTITLGGTTWYAYIIGPAEVPAGIEILTTKYAGDQSDMTIALWATGSSTTSYVDFGAVLFDNVVNFGILDSSVDTLYIRGMRAWGEYVGGADILYKYIGTGWPVEMIPNVQNHFSVMNTYHRGALATLADSTTTINRIDIIPRWLLL